MGFCDDSPDGIELLSVDSFSETCVTAVSGLGLEGEMASFGGVTTSTTGLGLVCFATVRSVVGFMSVSMATLYHRHVAKVEGCCAHSLDT